MPVNDVLNCKLTGTGNQASDKRVPIRWSPSTHKYHSGLPTHSHVPYLWRLVNPSRTSYSRCDLRAQSRQPHKEGLEEAPRFGRISRSYPNKWGSQPPSKLYPRVAPPFLVRTFGPTGQMDLTYFRDTLRHGVRQWGRNDP